MDAQQPPKASKLYPRSKKCDIEKTLGVVGTILLGSPKVKALSHLLYQDCACLTEGQDTKLDNQRKNSTEGAGLHHHEEEANVVGTCG